MGDISYGFFSFALQTPCGAPDNYMVSGCTSLLGILYSRIKDCEVVHAHFLYISACKEEDSFHPFSNHVSLERELKVGSIAFAKSIQLQYFQGYCKFHKLSGL